ncbi:taurine ABC transporter permease TauC [Methylibium rhizosphaerae]|uniref:taurine ABC transporter permease TauC n=1 Tax=Methylibium rhizosphaerae TaxID=2570323 RepID=UPI00112B016B|nr:taurine ABC transporter permease TauC [Methylibium rhizosphaerae]
MAAASRITLSPPQTAAARPRRIAHRRHAFWLGSATVLVLLAAWTAVTAAGWIAPLFLPPPSAVAAKFVTLATEGFMDATLSQHAAASLARVALALLLALATAIPLGLWMGLSPLARGLFDPLVEFYRPVPPLAYLPLIVIWFGIGELSKVLLIALAIFAPVVIATATGVRSVEQSRLRAALSFGASRAQLLRHVVLPSALPDILTGIRVGLGVGWSTLVAAELVAATRGLGFMVQSAAQFLNTDIVVLGIAVIALVAFTLELGLRALQRRLVPWQGRS